MRPFFLLVDLQDLFSDIGSEGGGGGGATKKNALSMTS